MAPSRKSPTHPMAATLAQVHPSPATWVLFERIDEGEFRINKIGQILADFRSDQNRIWAKFRTTFRTSYVHPYYGQEHWVYTPAELGLVPFETFWRLDWLNKPMTPPTDEEVRTRFNGASTPVRDRRDPYTFWLPHFIVKLQHAHKVLGCTAEEFRQIHLAEFYREMESEADLLFWLEEDDKQREADELA